jgi:galactokinase
MSSSSALECGFLFGINELFEIDLSKWQMIEISQQSNHNFLGLQGGIMDQFSILHGRKDHAMLLNCITQKIEYIPVELGHYHLVIIDSGVSHDLVTSAYNDRVSECKSGLQKIQNHHPSISTVSEISKDHIRAFGNELTESEFKRISFVIEENERVHQFCKALKMKDISTVGQLLKASHNGLKDQYEVSCEEMDYLVESAYAQSECIGARMMGGGFGGCTINVVEKQKYELFKNRISQSYFERFELMPTCLLVEIVDGIKVDLKV